MNSRADCDNRLSVESQVLRMLLLFFRVFVVCLASIVIESEYNYVSGLSCRGRRGMIQHLRREYFNGGLNTRSAHHNQQILFCRVKSYFPVEGEVSTQTS